MSLKIKPVAETDALADCPDCRQPAAIQQVYRRGGDVKREWFIAECTFCLCSTGEVYGRDNTRKLWNGRAAVKP